MSNTKIKILFIVQSLVKSGAERMIVEISNELVRLNAAEILIVGFDDRNEYPELSTDVPYLKINIIYSLSFFGKNNIQIQELQKIVDDFKPDIIHSNCYMQEAPVREINYKNAVFFTHLHDNMPAFRNFSFRTLFNKRLLTDYYEKRRLMHLYRKCDNNFIAISTDTYTYFKKVLPSVLSRKIIQLPNAINFNKFFNGKQRLPGKEKQLKLINVGHFAPKKNQVFLLDVLRILKDTGLDVMLTLVGDSGNIKEKIIAEAQMRGVDKNIILTGVVNNVEHYLSESDIYVHSAIYEAFCLVMLEAMASGLPVVSLDGKGNRDIIEQGKNGFMIYDQDARKFAQCIIDLVNDKSLYNNISTYAMEFAKRYDIKEYVDKLLAIYQQALRDKTNAINS